MTLNDLRGRYITMILPLSSPIQAAFASGNSSDSHPSRPCPLETVSKVSTPE
jgi:hypothetical protein